MNGTAAVRTSDSSPDNPAAAAPSPAISFHPGLWEGSSLDFGAPWWLNTKTSPIPPKHSLRASGTEQAVYYVPLSTLSVQAVFILQKTGHVALWHLEKFVLPAPGFGFL